MPDWIEEYRKLARHRSEYFRFEPRPRWRRLAAAGDRRLVRGTESKATHRAPASSSSYPDDPTKQWLADGPERSADALERLNATAPPDPAPPSTDTGVVWPRTETELRQALQSFADDDYVGMLHPRTELELSSTIEVRQRSNGGMSWGVNGQHARLHWVGPGGQDMLVYGGVDGVSNRGLYIEKLNFYGNGYAAAPAGACLKIVAEAGDPGSIYKFTCRDLWTSYATHGIHIAGAVFEGYLENCHGENHNEHGLYLEHLWTTPVGIVSNVFSVHPNYSRNYGAGIRSVYSHNLVGGSFVLNAHGGVSSDEGLRGMMLSNGENTGESVVVLSTGGYGSSHVTGEGSTDGSTHARKYEGGQWVSKGKPQLYLLDGDIDYEHCHVSYYGSGANADNVRVSKQDVESRGNKGRKR